MPKPHDGSAGGPELGDVGADRSKNAPVGDTDIEPELTAVVRTGRIEKLPDGHSEACGQTEKLVDRNVPAASLYCADRRAPPAVAEMLHASGKFVLSHVPKEAIRPGVCGQGVGGAAFLPGWRADPRRVRSAVHRDRRITLCRWRLDGHSPSDSSRSDPSGERHGIGRADTDRRTLYDIASASRYSYAHGQGAGGDSGGWGPPASRARSLLCGFGSPGPTQLGTSRGSGTSAGRRSCA